jgi:hypothetical protein
MAFHENHEKSSILSFALLLGLLSSCTSTQLSSDIDMSDPGREDLQVLMTTLENNHPDLYSVNKEKDFKALYEEILVSAPQMEDIECYFAVRELVAQVGDSHTMVGFPKDIAASLHALPIQIAYVNNAWRLIVVEKNQEPMQGSKMLSLNGVSIEQMMEREEPLVGYDNQVWFNQNVSQLLNVAEFYTYVGITENPSDPITLTIDHRTCQNVSSSSITPISITEFFQKEFVTLYDNPSSTGSVRVYYRTKFLDTQEDMLFIQYNGCASDPAFPIDAFIEETLALLVSSKKPAKIIVDLRYNGGGDLSLAEPMIDGLATYQRAQGFTLDVLIGERTFSSALMNEVQLKQRSNATLVGTPTGGSVNHYGEVKTFTLPDSGIPVRYSTKFFAMDKSHQGGSLQPDVLVTATTVEDLLSGVDTVVQTHIE